MNCVVGTLLIAKFLDTRHSLPYLASRCFQRSQLRPGMLTVFCSVMDPVTVPLLFSLGWWAISGSPELQSCDTVP